MMALLTLLIDYWFIVVWALAVIVAYHFGGKQLALLVLTGGLGASAYLLGRKTMRDNQREAVKAINEKREKAYYEIDSRHTDRNDVAERLHKHSF